MNVLCISSSFLFTHIFAESTPLKGNSPKASDPGKHTIMKPQYYNLNLKVVSSFMIWSMGDRLIVLQGGSTLHNENTRR